MRQIADLHIHSRYSRACSADLNLENLDKTCRVKGVDIIATGDFTFPDWFLSITDKLEAIPAGSALPLFKLKQALDDRVKFVLSTEVALICKQGDQCRRIHVVIQAPDLASAAQLNSFLDKNYNIRSDGRPILGMSARDLCRICFDIHPKFLVYPAHIWTPWFSVFGSKSGFNRLEECFGDYTPRIFAYETGLSSDPEMNWRFSELDRLTLLSNSDAHSLPNIAREANVFDLEEPSYDTLYEAIKNGKLEYTIEFYPEEGMYHYDGHRACGVSYHPKQTKKAKGICPVCKKPLVIGVMNRVEELADRPAGFRPAGKPGFRKLVELDKIIAEAFGVKSRCSKTVRAEYDRLIAGLGTEMDILLDEGLDNIQKIAGPEIAEGIRRVRMGELLIEAGFDGQYGRLKIFGEEERIRQKKLL
jgi:DNA helicase II / ATP-dependent DNA helicase PcrA